MTSLRSRRTLQFKIVVERSCNSINTFWKKNPALFYGLILLLGYIFVLQTAWALLPLLLLLRRRSLFISILLFLVPCSIVYQVYTFPSPGSNVEGTFYIHSIRKSDRFGQGWSYSGILKTDEGRLQCHCFSKHYMPANSAYHITGTIASSRGSYYALKITSPWEFAKKCSTLADLRFHLQEYVKRYIEGHITQERAAHFLIGIISGQMEDRLMLNEFGQLGLSHLMAISGLHFSLLAIFFHLFLRLFLPAKPEALCLMALLTGYFLFIGNTPSIFRAWCVTLIFLMGQLSERRGSALNSLGVALCLSLILNPLCSTRLSFHLSFLATGGILFFYTSCHQLINFWLPKRALQEVVKKSALWQYGYILTSLLREALALTFSVHVALLPLLLATFHTFPIASLIYNLFFPFLASLALLFFLASIPLGHWAHVVNGYYCDWILKITESPPLIFKSFDVANIPHWLLSAALTALLITAIGLKIKERTNRFRIMDDPLFDHL